MKMWVATVLSARCVLIPADLRGTRQPFSQLPGHGSCRMRSSPRNVPEGRHSQVCTQGGQGRPPGAARGGWRCLFLRWWWEGVSRQISKAESLTWEGTWALGGEGMRRRAARDTFPARASSGRDAAERWMASQALCCRTQHLSRVGEGAPATRRVLRGLPFTEPCVWVSVCNAEGQATCLGAGARQ